VPPPPPPRSVWGGKFLFLPTAKGLRLPPFPQKKALGFRFVGRQQGRLPVTFWFVGRLARFRKGGFFGGVWGDKAGALELCTWRLADRNPKWPTNRGWRLGGAFFQRVFRNPNPLFR